MSLPGSGGTVGFSYDPFGRRIQKSGPSGTTTYVYSGPNVIEEVNGSADRVAYYSQSPYIDLPLAEFVSGTTAFYEQDGLESVTSLSTAVGALANIYTYDALGNLTVTTGGLRNPFEYTGRDRDAETDLRYYRARYLDSSVGRFLSEDPLRFETGVNFYTYVKNNPIIHTDPSGLCAAMPPGEYYCLCALLTDVFTPQFIGCAYVCKCGQDRIAIAGYKCSILDGWAAYKPCEPITLWRMLPPIGSKSLQRQLLWPINPCGKRL